MKNKKLVLILSLVIILLVMAGGYAVYSSSLKVEGTGSIDSNFNIEVTDIKEESKEGKAVSVTEPTYTSSTATFNTKLQRPGDNIEYLVEITNNGTVDGKINTITITNPSNIVKVETRGIIEGEIIKSGEVKSYIVRIYIEENVKLTEDVTSVVKVETEIIQDDNQIFNEGIDGTVENKLAIESTKEESDYTSIKATVNAKGNGFKYYYSLDNENWTNGITSNTYTFESLEIGTRYTVYYKVEDENLNYVTESKWIETKGIDSPVIKVSNENEWTTTKEVTIEYPKIEGATYEYKVDEEEWQDASSSQKVEVTENSVVYAKIEIDGKVLESSKKITKIDNNEPILTLSTSKTTKSITVVANTTDDSGIDKYEYSIDSGATWIDNDKYNNYIFKNLVHNTEYTIMVRVTDKVGLTSISEITEITNLIETPTFKEDVVGTVEITYPEGCNSNLKCSYIKDSGEEVIVSETKEEVVFDADGTLIATVTDGTNYITSSTYTIILLRVPIEPGTVIAYMSDNELQGFIKCDGSAVSRTTYPELFAVIGTTYGSGDGTTTFNLPNISGKSLIGAGTADSGSAYNLGSSAGEKDHTLTIEEMPSHRHDSSYYGVSDGTITYNGKYLVGITYADSVGWNMKTSKSGWDSAHNNMQPYTVANYYISTGKKVEKKLEESAGVLNVYAGSSIPEGYLACDGSEVSRTTYANLFNVIGTTYGSGNGSTTFNLPNFAGKTIIGSGNDSDGNIYNLNDSGGEEKHTLTIEELPRHQHYTNDVGTADHTRSSTGKWLLSTDVSHDIGWVAETGYAGEGQPHNNMQPYTVMNYMISTGITKKDVKEITGTTLSFMGNIIPEGYLECDGSEVSRTTYANLFNVIGTTYGSGNGSTTFNLPNLKGRLVIGKGTNYTLGSIGGEETHVLTEAEMAEHQHGDASEKGMSEGTWTYNGEYLASSSSGNVSWNHMTSYVGGDKAHNNMMPYLVNKYIIATG